MNNKFGAAVKVEAWAVKAEAAVKNQSGSKSTEELSNSYNLLQLNCKGGNAGAPNDYGAWLRSINSEPRSWISEKME
jgi:hypothetical protein